MKTLHFEKRVFCVRRTDYKPLKIINGNKVLDEIANQGPEKTLLKTFRIDLNNKYVLINK